MDEPRDAQGRTRAEWRVEKVHEMAWGLFVSTALGTGLRHGDPGVAWYFDTAEAFMAEAERRRT